MCVCGGGYPQVKKKKKRSIKMGGQCKNKIILMMTTLTHTRAHCVCVCVSLCLSPPPLSLSTFVSNTIEISDDYDVWQSDGHPFVFSAFFYSWQSNPNFSSGKIVPGKIKLKKSTEQKEITHTVTFSNLKMRQFIRNHCSVLSVALGNLRIKPA